MHEESEAQRGQVTSPGHIEGSECTEPTPPWLVQTASLSPSLEDPSLPALGRGSGMGVWFKASSTLLILSPKQPVEGVLSTGQRKSQWH